MNTQEEVIEMARQAGFNLTGTRDIWCDSTFVLAAFAKLVADKKEAEMQERIDKLHNMYELVCKHRDILMAQQDAMIAALRGKMQ
jgi:hypothetical protein